VSISSRMVTAEVCQFENAAGVRIYLIKADQYFARPNLYGTAAGDYLDNAERFAFLSRAVVALLYHLGPPDVLHAHDWQTALVPAFLRADSGRYPGLESVRTVFTVHNMGYQGLFWHHDWHLLNLDWRFFTPDYLEFYGKINYLKGGLVWADAITTVSPTYAQEIQTPEFGYGLDGVLRARRAALSGILNGVDYDEWSPERDRFIAARYSADDLKGKAACKADLQATVGLPADAKVPVFGIVSRLADQKGFDLLAAIAPELLQKRLQVVILGSGDTRYQSLFGALAKRFPKRFKVSFTFDEALAHKIEAGSDIFLMPSRYEPCGLNQIYSLRYGTIPIVRATGGLEDTIVDVDATKEDGTGFKFTPYTPAALLSCIERALRAYRARTAWTRLIRNAMRMDFSWDRSAQAYAELYRRVSA